MADSVKSRDQLLSEVAELRRENARDAMPTGGTVAIDLSLFHLKPGERPLFPGMQPGKRQSSKAAHLLREISHVDFPALGSLY